MPAEVDIIIIGAGVVGLAITAGGPSVSAVN